MLISGSIWLTNTARQLPPNVTLDGLDISFDTAPPREFLPPNIHLRYWDIFSEVPEELIGVYDIVHISLLAFILRSNDIDHAMGKFLQLLSK